jgi:23S rRNA (uracil1939-C5)-methyltransferase
VSVVKVDRISAGGDGVARLADGMVVFVPRTAPGDEVEIALVERKPRYARGEPLRILRPGPDRIVPECPHYVGERCGGCQLQHLSPGAQREAKREFVGDALRRIGRRDVDNPVVAPAPAMWRYRTKITLAAAGERLGLHQYGRPAAVFTLADCRIAREPLMQLWTALASERRLLPEGLEDLVLREDRDAGLHVIVGGGRAPWSAEPLARAVGRGDVSYWWRPQRGAARVVGGSGSAFPALAFEQVNPGLAEQIRREAVDLLGDVAGRTVWDLYGGVGDTAALLAARGAVVYSVDQDASAVEWARACLPQDSVTCLVGLVEESLHRLPPPDAVVVNPPRAGLSPRVSGALDQWARERSQAAVCYVSCDPATLARDLGRLPALAIERIRAFDLFPHTSHVETLVLLTRR